MVFGRKYPEGHACRLHRGGPLGWVDSCGGVESRRWCVRVGPLAVGVSAESVMKEHPERVIRHPLLRRGIGGGCSRSSREEQSDHGHRGRKERQAS